MPLVRVEVKNEYGLGKAELYNESNPEDPKAVLDAVAVSALVGVLRQLGHLTEFAADVFHGLQEETMTAASRIQKLRVRVKHIEAALPPLEKNLLDQKSHFHFAYSAGTDWHACIPNRQNHFICYDLPQFVMDCYEECCDPPQLHLLDKFDTGGPGSCLKRYSDPTFIKGASASPEKVPKNKKDFGNKKKGACQSNGDVSHGAAISNQFGRSIFASSDVAEQISPTQTVSTFDVTLKPALAKPSNSFDSTDSGFIKCVFHPSNSMELAEHEPNQSSSARLRTQHYDTLDSAFVDKHTGALDDSSNSSYQEQTGSTTSFVTWYEKTDIVEPTRQQHDCSRTPETFSRNFDLHTRDKDATNFRSVDPMDFHFDHDYAPASILGDNQLADIESEQDKYMDALNTIEFGGTSYDIVDGSNIEPSISNMLSCSGCQIPDVKVSCHSDKFYHVHGNQSVETKYSSGRHLKEIFEGGLLVKSPSSSPPLQHMKIPLHPVNVLENSKLTLKLPDQIRCPKMSEDMFPSFQLVPEPVIPLHDDVSKDDGDTSYKSSPDMSDDCLSHHSESSYAQNKRHEFYDTLFNISSMDYVSSSMELEGRAGRSLVIDSGLQTPYAGFGEEPSQSSRLLDLPSFYTLNPLFKQEINNDEKYLLEWHSLEDSTPHPPPLPPLEWRTMKLHSDVAENKQNPVPVALNHAFDMKSLGSTISMHSEPNLVKQQLQNLEEVIAFPMKYKQPEQLKLNVQKEADQTTNIKSMDEKKDFLHQIRTKSFSLRGTMTTLPTTTNVKATAVLEKAHAIRQAVGSDDGEEGDNWSDA